MKQVIYFISMIGLLFGIYGCSLSPLGAPQTCKEYKKANNNFHNYITDRFDKVYFKHNNYKGASIEAVGLMQDAYHTKERGNMVYLVSRERRKAQQVYNWFTEYTKLAKDSGCNTVGYKENPLIHVMNKISLNSTK